MSSPPVKREVRPRHIEPMEPEEALESLEALQMIQERLVNDRLGELAEAVHGLDSAERALAGIVLDTLGEKEELANVVRAWQAGTGRPVRPRERNVNLADLLESFLEVKRSAARRYWAAAAACPDPTLSEALERLARQASEHAAILLTMRVDAKEE